LWLLRLLLLRFDCYNMPLELRRRLLLMMVQSRRLEEEPCLPTRPQQLSDGSVCLFLLWWG